MGNHDGVTLDVVFQPAVLCGSFPGFSSGSVGPFTEW